MGTKTTAAILQLLEDQAAAETLAATVLKGAEYDHAKATLTQHTDDAELNAKNARLWEAFQIEFRDPARRGFKFAHEMSVGEFAAAATEEGRATAGGFVVNNHDMGTLFTLAGDPAGAESVFVQAQVKRAQKEGRVIGDPSHRWPGETDEQRTRRINELVDSMNVAHAAAQHAAETNAQIDTLRAGGAEPPEVKSYLNRRISEMEKTAAREKWGEQTVSPLQLPEVRDLQRTAAAIDAGGE